MTMSNGGNGGNLTKVLIAVVSVLIGSSLTLMASVSFFQARTISRSEAKQYTDERLREIQQDVDRNRDEVAVLRDRSSALAAQLDVLSTQLQVLQQALDALNNRLEMGRETSASPANVHTWIPFVAPG